MNRRTQGRHLEGHPPLHRVAVRALYERNVNRLSR